MLPWTRPKQKNYAQRKFNFTLLFAEKKIQLSLQSQTGDYTQRRGRVVDRDGLENHCTARYRGFESLRLCT